MLLAADIGGTKTLIGLFEPGGERPTQIVMREYGTRDFESFEELVHTFLDETGSSGIASVCAGIAGPVTGLVARLTSAPWVADLAAVSRQLGGGCRARLMNDLETMAMSVPVLEPHELKVLQEGVAVPTGSGAILAAGTGLGEALLHNVGGAFSPVASEGGHADFAARTTRELALVEFMTKSHGRVEVEAVVSGRGLVNIFRFTHRYESPRSTCRHIGPEAEGPELAAAISRNALGRQCPLCEEALSMFVDAYGAEAGNLALRYMATAGVYIGGGIAPKILPALETGAFMDAFLSKEPLVDLLRTIPVKVILNPAAGLLGAAVGAQETDD